jgi:small GTP-binding protein
MSSAKYIIKLCLLGDGAVGKTSLVRRFVFDVFDDKYLMSFGTKVSKKSMTVEGQTMDLMIWDILGQKSHVALHEAYYRGAAGALAVCDFTRPETMKNIKSWVGSFRSVVGEKPVLILGNKSDLEKAYTLVDLREFASSVGCEVLETSAKSGLNVENAFAVIGKKLLEEAK